MAAAVLPAQTVFLPVPELQATASLTFEPVPGSPPPYLAATIDPARTAPQPAIAVTIDCLGHRERFLRKPDNAIAPVPQPNARFADTGVPSSIDGLTVSPSRLFLYTTGSRTLLFFLSVSGAGDAAALYVLGFHPDGAPYRVFVSDHFDLSSVESKPRAIRIIGRSTAPQAVCCNGIPETAHTPYSTTYDPYSIYLVAGDRPAVLSAAESEAYNRRHYLWAGPQPREDYTVLYNIPGHPRLFGLPEVQAEELMSKVLESRQKHP